MKTIFKNLVLLLFTLSLISCGFHLRGSIPLSPRLNNVYIKTKSPYGDLAENLRAYLKMSHVNLVSTPEAADAILQILSEDTTQQLLGVSSTQQTRQYSLILTVTFQVTDNKNRLLVAPQTVSENRTLAVNTNQILASSSESASLTQSMRREIVFDIMERLSSKEITQVLNRNHPQ